MSATVIPRREVREGLERSANFAKAFSDLIDIVIEPVAYILATQEEPAAPQQKAILPESLRIEHRAKELKNIISFEPERTRLIHTLDHLFEYGPSMLTSSSWELIQKELKCSLDAMKEKGPEFESLVFSQEFFLLVYSLAKMLFEKGIFDKASNILFFLVTLCPACPQFWVAYGLLTQKTRHFNTALMAYMNASDLEPDSIETKLHLADCYADMFIKEESVAILELVAKSAPLSESVVSMLASIRLKISHNWKTAE